jgi:hypothetical protein
MGAFTDLVATSTEFAEYHDVIKLAAQVAFPTVTAPEQCLRTEALVRIRTDIQEALGLLPYETEDMDLLDDIATGQAALMRQVLAAKQLAMVLKHPKMFQPPGTRNYTVMREQEKLYDRYKAGFPGLFSRNGIVSARVHRMRR